MLISEAAELGFCPEDHLTVFEIIIESKSYHEQRTKHRKLKNEIKKKGAELMNIRGSFLFQPPPPTPSKF